MKVAVFLFLMIARPAVQAQDTTGKTLSFFAEMSNRYDKVYKYIPQGRLYLTDHFRTKFDFDIKSQPTPDLQLTARFSATKYWNQWYTQNQADNGQFNFSTDTRYKSDAINLTLAYFNYKPFSWLEVLGGRLPTVDGSPVHFYRGSVADATLPKLAFGAEVDGALLFFNHGNFSVYTGYLPFLLQNYSYQNTSISSKPLVNNTQTEAETLAPRAAVGLKARFDDLKLTAFIHHSWINYLRFPDATMDASFFDSTLSGSAQLTSSLFTNHKNLLFHVDLEDIGKTKLDAAASYIFTTLQSNGTVGVASGAGAGRSLGGYGTNLNDTTFNGGILLLALHYPLPLEKLNYPQVGTEYLNSTSGAFYYDRNTDDVSQFYATRGQGYHFYVNQPLNSALFVRAGYRLQYFTTTPWALGESQPNSSKIDTYYADVKAIF